MLKKILIILSLFLYPQAALFCAESSFNPEYTEKYPFSFNHVPITVDAQALVSFILNPDKPVLEDYFPGYSEYKELILHNLKLLAPNSPLTLEEMISRFLKDLTLYANPDNNHETEFLLLEAFLLACSKFHLLNSNVITCIKKFADTEQYLYIKDFLVKYRIIPNTITHMNTPTQTSLTRLTLSLSISPQRNSLMNSVLFGI